jgi:acyl carrier protein
MSDQLADISADIGRVMGSALLREPLGPDDNFFDHGGDSLRAVEMLQQLFEQYGMADDSAASEELQAKLLTATFDKGTPAELAAILAAAASGTR